MYPPANMKRIRYIFLLISWSLTANVFAKSAKKETVVEVSEETDYGWVRKYTTKTKKDTLLRHSPSKATLRSALIPGWGQAYNKEYWKIPLVYAVVGIPAGFFVYNNTWYKRTKRAFEIRVNN